ncbi:response regulator [Desulfosudis oleivorans]|uniref:Response regulator receiver protein n=1 Tax=Desulfosudis oleivorans (strain DSM 6200 / JCM 39069 / Hxd3) TaxID=96561 RepID=A8ZVX7_DESOH|nr:response regulator [Desulfosudis oleivorans]ABW66686.1 response regulator receiver protein [Desulfosudis oleivorans Hxd3]
MHKILIVDDSASIREAFTGILSPLAHCRTAANGQEAVDMIKQNTSREDRFDLVLMDIIMPEKDGLTAVKEIREFEKQAGWTGENATTIIIVTTINNPSRILVAQYECGADAYITKPFTEQTVLQALSNNGVSLGAEAENATETQNRWDQFI